MFTKIISSKDKQDLEIYCPWNMVKVIKIIKTLRGT